jgi:hypothetical protein
MKEDYGGKISREGGMMKNERKTETMKNERGMCGKRCGKEIEGRWSAGGHPMKASC